MATWITRSAQTDDLDSFIEEFSHDPEFRQAYEDAQSRSTLLRHLIRVRQLQNLSQTDVAKFMRTTQSAVSELEGGSTDPQLATLQRYARAVNVRLQISVIGAASRDHANLVAPWASVQPSTKTTLAALALSRRQTSPSVVYEAAVASP
jgi:transcriptional regulator with XRE-family HTH domain